LAYVFVDQGVISFRLAAGAVLVQPHDDSGFQVAGYVLFASRAERRGSVLIQTVTILKEGISSPVVGIVHARTDIFQPGSEFLPITCKTSQICFKKKTIFALY
jgi:hypothetical protein